MRSGTKLSQFLRDFLPTFDIKEYFEIFVFEISRADCS